jgi:hypothetical protein
MRKRRLLLCTGVLVLVGVAGLLLAPSLRPVEPGVTWRNYERIHYGMTMTEGEEVFGSRADKSEQVFPLVPGHKTEVEGIWNGRGFFVELHFDDNGRVYLKALHEQHEPLLDRLRRLLPW